MYSCLCVCHDSIVGSKSVPPLIPNIDITKRWQANFRARPFYPRGRNPNTHLKPAIWAAGSIWKLWRQENLLSCREYNYDSTVVQSSRSDLLCPCSQLCITDTVDNTNLSLWAFRQSTVRANTQYRWVRTVCQIDILGTQTAFTRREVDEHRDCPRYSVRTRNGNTSFTVSQK